MKRTYLIQKRLNTNFSQSDIANLVGISRQYYNSIENGLRRPSPEIAKKIANCLNFKDEWYKLLENDTSNISVGINNNFYTNLKKNRQLKELSVNDICTLTQINKERYIAIENGLEPTTDELILLKTILNF
ncbi:MULTISPECIES: helix-turn-helix transcriptional regulator [Megamonas]|jgi:putative transcriptional regulator|uniref:Helix-turn-helix transcriptional regulator n=2 Tax=Megamonas funiformis TaxID=437897 RepID=A0AAW4U0C8_9FIRM|nr:MULTISPECIES: helix-turn-helix transcriptional regulator [Megamonas]MCB6827989.1 helix-turn-helix transcriptional regulator [Megamonas funiformis]